MLQELNDAVESVKTGDKSAYRRIVEQMLPVLRAYVISKSMPGMDVDDIVQRTFIEAYQSIGKFRKGTDFRAWLVTIARYQTLSEATRLKRQADYHSRFLPVEISRQMEKRLADDELEDHRLPFLQECLKNVRKSSRELVRRRYEEDLSMDQIADVLKRTSGAVRKELCLIRKQLHECIQRKLALDDMLNREESI
ncbi:sigma-70 family RNA polymerase sigma factor [Bremerella sp.]|uniref:sigma-70 family RNA polymerase sigma factor n=1 Tax=Bremerella sp. TaxID=2795602 RepID=UPI00391A50C2